MPSFFFFGVVVSTECAGIFTLLFDRIDSHPGEMPYTLVAT